MLSADSLLENLADALNLQRIMPQEDEFTPSPETARSKIWNRLGEEEKKVYMALGQDAMSVDEISKACGLTLLQTMNALLGLQLKHCAEEISKNRYSLKLAS